MAGARALHDALGPEAALAAIESLLRLGNGTTLHALTDAKWSHLFAGSAVHSIHRLKDGLVINCAIQPPGWSLGGGMIIMDRGDLFDMSATVLAAAIGRPITTLFEHFLIDDGMIIKDIMSSDRTQSWIGLTGTRARIGRIRETLARGDRP